jgi:hypothetical protein
MPLHRFGGTCLLAVASILASGGRPVAQAADPMLDLPDVSLVDTATVSAMPAPAVGEVREFVGAVASINCSRWEIVPSDDPDVLVSQCEHYRIHFRRSEHLNMFRITAGDEPALTFDPAYPAIEFPLEVGRRWRRKYVGDSMIEGIQWRGDVSCEVADFADVDVAAGRFKAYRIECRDHWKVADVASSVTSTTWYAPEVAGVIKTRNYEDPRLDTELKAYSR